MNVHVNVFDGKKYYPCRLEIVSESGLSRVIFINKRKKYRTKNHLRVVDAIREISEKLESYGYTLLLCQCCKYFKSNVDGTVNQVKGFCEYKFANRTPGDILPTVLYPRVGVHKSHPPKTLTPFILIICPLISGIS